MKKINLLGILILMMLLSSCSKAFWGGAAGGTVAAGAGYEYRAHQQLEQLEDDLNAGRITQEEYDIRKDQIEKGSLLQ